MRIALIEKDSAPDVVRRVYDFLAEHLPAALTATEPAD